MARGVNKVILLGNLGADPERRDTASGMAVTTLRVATSEQWTDKQTGEKRENTEWHRVVMFGRLGEIAAQYLGKGSQVYIEGRIQTRKWQGQDGQDRYTTEIVANEMQMVGSRGGAGGGAGGGMADGGNRFEQDQDPGPSGWGPSSSAAPSSAPGHAPAPAAAGRHIADDDVPF